MKTSRQRILEFIKERKLVSADEISRSLKMSAANARHHLAALQREGVVQATGQRANQRRGRPTLLYGLAQRKQQHNLGRLAAALLAERFGALGAEEKVEAMRRVAEQLDRTPRTLSPNLTQRLAQAVSLLNEMNYEARWEARAEAPRVTFFHCPYVAILPEYPELCIMDAILIENLLAAPVTQTARLEPTPQGLHCAFALKR